MKIRIDTRTTVARASRRPLAARRSGAAAAAAALLLPALLALSAAAWAQTPIDETRAASAEISVSVENTSGTVTVIGGERSQVHVTGTLGRNTSRLAIEGDEDRLVIRVEIPKNAKDVEDTHLRVELPRGSRLNVSTVSGDIDVSEVAGRMQLTAVSGDVRAQGKTEEIEVSVVSGEVRLQVESPLVSVNCISGDVHIDGPCAGADIETVSGDLHVSSPSIERLRCRTVSGDIEFDGGIAPRGSLGLSCHSGDVSLLLPAETDADFEISTFNGEIEGNLDSGTRRTRTESEPGSRLNFKTGAGSATVAVSTFSGDIILRWKE